MRLTYKPEAMSPNISSFLSAHLSQGIHHQEQDEHVVEMTEGSYFGEWTLLGEHISLLRAVSVGDVVCAVITKEKFDSAVGPLSKFSQEDLKYVMFCILFLPFDTCMNAYT